MPGALPAPARWTALGFEEARGSGPETSAEDEGRSLGDSNFTNQPRESLNAFTS